MSDEFKGTVVGMEITELVKIKTKLDYLSIELHDLVEYMDRDKVQLFAELKTRNKVLEARLRKIIELANV